MSLEPFHSDWLDQEAVMAEIEARVAEATRQANGDRPAANGRVVQGSPAELRGIPAVGRAAGGSAIPGTIPGEGLDDWPTPDEA